MKFSIIIPVHDVAEWLPACLDSVLASARTDVADAEFICVDDGSSDGSGGILDDYAARDRRFRVIHQANGGVSSARNRGMDEATGDWLLFVDGDDFVRDTWLTDVAEAVGRREADLIGFEKMPFYGSERWNDVPAAYESIDIMDEIGDRLVGCCVYQFAYSAERFGDLRFSPYSVGEDLVFTAKAYARAVSCVLSARQEYGYRFRAGSATHSSCPPAKLLDVVRFNVEMFRALESSGKRVGDAFTRGRGDEWLVSLPRMLLSRRGEPGVGEVLEAWFDSLEFASGCGCLPESRRVMAGRIAARRTVSAIRRFCLFPAWLNRLSRRILGKSRKRR